MKTFLIFCLVFLAVSTPLRTEMFYREEVKTFGTLMKPGLPVIGGTVSFLNRDSDGAISLLLGTVMTCSVTRTMKYFIDSPRPDQQNNKSFPSGHSAEAFSAATFLNVRYGIRLTPSLAK